MRRLAALAFVLLAARGAAAIEIGRYDTRVEVGEDGHARVAATLEVKGAAAGRLRIPVGFGALGAFQPGEAPAGVVLAPRSAGGATWIEAELPESVPAAFRLAFSFRVEDLLAVPKAEEGQKPAFPAGSRILRHAFVNTQEAPIGRYEVKVLLPESGLVHAIREQSPKPRRKEFLPRVELDRFDGRQGAMLQHTGLRQGDRASMELEVVDARRSWMWLIALVPIAVGYLYAFRDLVSPARAVRAP
jgi:hypothetical protein